MDGIRRSWVIGAAAIAALVAAGWVTLEQVRTLDAAAGEVRRSQDVRLAIERALSTLKDAETSTRGYANTRSDVFLPLFEGAAQQLTADLERVTTLVADNPAQLERAQELTRLAEARMAPLRTAVRMGLTNAPTFRPEEAVRAQLDGNARMEAVRAQARMMHEAEERLLQERMGRTARARTTALLGSSSTTAFAAALVVLILVTSARSGRKLRQSEEWLATTLKSIGDAVIATDRKGCVIYLNPVASQLTGWSTQEARTHHLTEVFNIVSEDTGVPVESPVDRVLREGVVVGLANHTQLVRRDGTRIPIEDSGAPIRDANGQVSGVVMVFKDASVQRAAEIALRENEERLRLAVEGAELGTWDLDLATNELIWNDQYARIMGFEPGTPMSRELARSRIVPEDKDLVARAMQKARSDRQPYQLEFRISRVNDSAERWIAVVGRYVFEEGKAARMISIITDITERRRLEQRVRETQKLDALGTLAGGIAHDFNNILLILRGNLLLIEADLPPEHPIAPAISEMSRACNRARDLVRQILMFGRQQEQDRKLIDLAEVIQEALGLLRSTIPVGIELRSRFGSNLPTVLADASQIHQIVMNLGINASQAIGQGAGVISVDLDEVHVDANLAGHSPDLNEARYVRLRFGDSGTGMTREVMERIFEPFFTTKPPGSGTGLGLAVVRGIVKSHDGAITVYSEPGKGTQFHLYFPVVEGAAAGSIAPPPAPIKGEGQHILYLDDEEALVLLARRLLERIGYKVSGFSDPSQGLAAFEADPNDFDLVLSDLSMPGLSGIDVARRILEIRPDIPVLLASGYVRSEDVEVARSIGVREVIWKPATINEMGELLGRLLAKMMPRA
jgi:PAS domain S-box-containing protein